MNRRHSLPAEVYALVESTPATVLLECGKPGSTTTDSCSRLFLEPLQICEARSPAELTRLFGEIETAVAAGHTAAGFFTYECGACFEPKAGMQAPRAGQPLAWFGIYDRSYRFDHATGHFLDGEPDLTQMLGAQFSARFDQAEGEIPKIIKAEFPLDESEYACKIAAIHEWIRAGDVYQLNFTAPFRVETTGRVAALYGQLRARQPVEYGALIHWQPGRHILSFSPELFFRIDGEHSGRRITARPMKGTAARGRTTREDCERSEWLKNDAKNRAENLMIVDLLRNDLGRLARFGSVRTENLFAVERYPTLWQMTSTVIGDLRQEVGFHDVFRALFPCGSITGAPKVRAMQLLSQLEQQPRGIYTGAIGFFSAQRTVFNVAIRTLELEAGRGAMGVGSGIVIDSNPAEEYRECLLKAAFLTQSETAMPQRLELIETMLWDGGYPLLELHLDRLADSASYFDFPCDRAGVKAALEAHAQNFTGTTPRRVRLLLDEDGEPRLADEALPAPADKNGVVRVCISKHRTDPADKFLYHKTTHRALYAMAYQEAVQAGYDDVLFLNQRGEITEGAISNVFIEKGGRLLTPPIDCGLLAGVYRRHVLESQPNVEERILRLEDLSTADSIYITNAIRGQRRAEVEL